MSLTQMFPTTLLLFSFLHLTFSLHLRAVNVPTLNIAGSSAALECNYESGTEQIYSVKWYKGGREIYRYLPSNPSPVTIYPRHGVKIDQERSNSSVITLNNLTLGSTGRYRCEVSSEAPMFSTKSGFGDLLVLVLPSSPPVIQGGRGDYAPGDFVQLNCTSSESKPAADLTWFINDSRADPSYVVPHPVVTSRKTGLHTSTSSLYLTLGPNHFTEKGDISISCTASIKLLDWTNNAKNYATLHH